MAKTRRKKLNRSPLKPFRNARAYVVEQGDTVTTKGVRGRTKIVRVTGEGTKRIASVRSVEIKDQIIAKPVGDIKPTPTFVGRVYTGVARSKPYPYRSKKRGAPEFVPGLMARATKAVKRVVVGDAG
jgi:hypothetical protein